MLLPDGPPQATSVMLINVVPKAEYLRLSRDISDYSTRVQNFRKLALLLTRHYAKSLMRLTEPPRESASQSHPNRQGRRLCAMSLTWSQTRRLASDTMTAMSVLPIGLRTYCPYATHSQPQFDNWLC